jgi:hypothetical protein
LNEAPIVERLGFSVCVIVPREAVGERCEIMHEVNLLDIDIDIGDVTPVDEVVSHFISLSK